MDLKLFLLMVFLTTVASAATKEEEFYVHNHSDDYVDYEYDDEPRNVQTDQPTSIVTDNPAVGYEVTEIVDDIPNNATYTGPVVPNFSIKLPHNNATVAKNETNKINNSNKDNLDNFFNEFDDYNNKVNKNLRKNSISIFHVNAEFDDDKPAVQNININQLPNIGIFNVREHIDRFRDGVVNHIHNVNNREVYNNVNHGILVPNVIAGPIGFLNKLHKKGAAVATKLHNVIFGNLDDY